MDFVLSPSGLPIVISVVLFLVTLAIIFILRSEDKKERRFEMVHRLVAKTKAEMSQAGDQLIQRSAAAEERMAQKERDAKQLISLIDSQLANIKDHSDDLAELQRVLDYYHQMLGQLAQMTEQAELRTTQVKDEVRKVEMVRTQIDVFLSQVDEADAAMQVHREAIETLRQESIGQVKELQEELSELDRQAVAGMSRHQDELKAIERSAVSALNHEADEFMSRRRDQLDQLFDAGLRRTDAAFQTMIHTVQEFLRELDSRLESCRQASGSLLDAGSSSLASVITELQGYQDRISMSEATLQELDERREQAKEAVERLDLERQELSSRIEAAGVSLSAAMADVRKAEEERISAEAKSCEAHEDAARAHEAAVEAERRKEEAEAQIAELREAELQADRQDPANEPAQKEPAPDEKPALSEPETEMLESDPVHDDDLDEEDVPDSDEDSPFSDLDDEDLDDDLAEIEDLMDFDDDLADDRSDVDIPDEDTLDYDDDRVSDRDADDFSVQVEDLLDDLEGDELDALDPLDDEYDGDYSESEELVPDEPEPEPSEDADDGRRRHVAFVPVGEEEEISLDDDQ